MENTITWTAILFDGSRVNLTRRLQFTDSVDLLTVADAAFEANDYSWGDLRILCNGVDRTSECEHA